MSYTRRTSDPRTAFLLLVLVLLATAQTAQARSGPSSTANAPSEKPGSINGYVLDASKRGLPGATVHVEPGGVVVVTDNDGSYVVPGLSPGHYHVEVSYIGFETLGNDVDVSSGTSSRLNFTLKQDTRITENVVVTASRQRGEVEALNERKNSDEIVNVLPEEVIVSLPNANLADSIGRLPSISLERDEGEGKYVQIRGLASNLTNVTIDGVQIPSVSGSNENYGRQIKLDGFPSDLVGGVQLYKTTSPDQEGDSIGGTVNIVSRLAGDEEHYSLNGLAGYTDIIGGRGSYVVNGNYSNRYGEDKQLGFILSGTYDWNGRGINDVEPGPAVVSLPNGQSTNQFNTMDIRDYRYYRQRWGAAGGLDYRLDPNSTLYFKGFYNQFLNYGDRWVTTPNAGNFLTPTLTDNTGNYTGSVQNRRKNELTYSLVAGGNNDLESVLIDYFASYSHARQNRIGEDQGDFSGPQNVAFHVDPSSNGFFPHLIPLGGVNPFDPSQYTLTDYTTTYETSNAYDAAGVVNVTIPFSIAGFPSTLKFGGKYREENKVVVTNNKIFNVNGSQTLLMSQVLDTFTDPNYYFNRYEQGPNASLNAITNYFNANPGAFTEDINQEHLQNDPNNFTVNEKIAAGYVMDTTSFGPVNVMAGVRVESTNAHYTGYIVTTDANGNWQSTSPTSGGNSYTNPLPMVGVRWAIDPQTNLRAVWAWHIGRPDYGLLPPSFFVSNDKKEVDAGNPNLKPQKDQSYDLMVEHFFGTVGVVSAGGFYKNLTEPIYLGSASTIHGGPYDGYTLFKPVNGPSAYIYGVEVTWQQHLSFLPGMLQGLGIIANYTYTQSQATFDPTTGRSGTAQLERTTPNEYNLGLTYDSGGFSSRVALSYNSATIFAYKYTDGAPGGPTGPNGDQYLYPHLQLDMQLMYTLPSGITVVASFLNLTNEVFGFYLGSPQYNNQREFYSPTFAVGLRLAR
jgi:TonB-dependent receptor